MKLVGSPRRPWTNTTGGASGAVRSRCSSGTSQRSGIERSAVPAAAISPPIMRQLTFPVPTIGGPNEQGACLHRLPPDEVLHVNDGSDTERVPSRRSSGPEKNHGRRD